MTIRIPSRSDSSRRSEMPSIVFSRASSAIFSISLRLVDLIRDLGDDDRDAVALLRLLDLGPRAHHHRAAAGRVGLQDALPADDEAA